MIPADLDSLRAGLDRVLLGQADAKTALLLALIAREHAYLEGPPGCGKSALAAALPALCGARSLLRVFHRDTSAAELLGDTHLRRERRGAGRERLALERTPGALAEAEILVLDDLARAPGEALAPLLRVLGERRLGGQTLPLECALATAGPADLESYADALEPPQLDRFALQVRLRGLIQARFFEAARALLDRPEPPQRDVGPRAVIDTEQRHALQRAAAALPIEPPARAALLRAVQRLRAAAGDEPVLLSDRSFARAAPAVLRAHALLRGAERVEPVDVRALRFMLARRVPESLEPHVAAILEDALSDAPPALSAPAAVRPATAGEGGGIGGEPVPVPALETVPAPLEGVAPLAQPRGADESASVDALVEALAGRIERGAVARGDDPGGQPRGWRRLRRLDELFDADPVDAWLLAQGRSPGGIRVYRRERENSGGTLALLRDVSASMEGRLARWAGQIVAGVVRTAARRRMRVGYIEFNHEAERFAAGGAFFHRRYRRLLALASRRRAEGRTNYEAPLRAALAELRKSPGRERHVVLLTDGVPVLGDPAVRSERALARELGVKVHTIFLGLSDCPEVLDEISRETQGASFAARPRPDGHVVVRERFAGGGRR